MVQNHLMQVMSLVAMEAPASLEHQAVRNEKSKVLEAVRPISRAEVPGATVRGQYTAGEIGGTPVPGYREEPGVPADSTTETYAAVQFMIDNWRWAGVPFYLRSGKRLPRRVTEIVIQFRRAPHLLFRHFGEQRLERNVLIIRIQPNEGIHLRFGVKVPGSGMVIQPVSMEFDYSETFQAEPPEAYERLLLDCMLGDITLFSREDWMDLSWQLIDPILEAWSEDTSPLPEYPAGSWGPYEACDLLTANDHVWWDPE
jgi:glucose-6-phosphate 1-dehydrogenase